MAHKFQIVRAPAHKGPMCDHPWGLALGLARQEPATCVCCRSGLKNVVVVDGDPSQTYGLTCAARAFPGHFDLARSRTLVSKSRASIKACMSAIAGHAKGGVSPGDSQRAHRVGCNDLLPSDQASLNAYRLVVIGPSRTRTEWAAYLAANR